MAQNMAQKSVNSASEWNWVAFSINVNQVNFVDPAVEFAISLLIFCLLVPSVIDSGMLKSLIILVFLSISAFISISFSFMYFEALLLEA